MKIAGVRSEGKDLAVETVIAHFFGLMIFDDQDFADIDEMTNTN